MSNTQFVQCAHFGVTFGFRFEGGRLYLAAGFAHKESPNGGRSNFEQFCRAKGRAVTNGRLNGLEANPDAGIPYTAVIETTLAGKGSFKAVRTSLWGVIERLKLISQIPASQADIYAQVENDELFEMAKEAISEDHGG